MLLTLLLTTTLTLSIHALIVRPPTQMSSPPNNPSQPPLPTFRGHCVNTTLFPTFAGYINPDDCYTAQSQLELNTQYRSSRTYTFWSANFTRVPPPNGWELPAVVEYKSCTILIQITKEFGDNTIPFYQGGYLPTSRLSTTVKGRWDYVIGAVAAVRQQCLKARAQPGWADVEGAAGTKAAVVMVLPAGSAMVGEWAGVEGALREVGRDWRAESRMAML